MENPARVLLLLTIVMAIWSVAVTLVGYNGVMAQSFIVPKDTPVFWGPFANWGFGPDDAEILVAVPSRPDFDGDGCKVKYRWPNNKSDRFKDKEEIRFGFPPNTNRGWPSVKDLFYADGFELQIRVVRNDMVSKWKTMAVKSLRGEPHADPNNREFRVSDQEEVAHADKACTGEQESEWTDRYRLNSVDWTRQLSGVGDNASAALSKIVRARFQQIIVEATTAFVVWAVAVPLSIIVLALAWFSIFQRKE